MIFNTFTFTASSTGLLSPLVMPADYDGSKTVDVEFLTEGAAGDDGGGSANGDGAGAGSYGRFNGITLGALSACRIELASGAPGGINKLVNAAGKNFAVTNGKTDRSPGADYSDDGADVFHPGGSGGLAGTGGGGGGGGGATSTANGTDGATNVMGEDQPGTNGLGGSVGGGNGGKIGTPNGAPGAAVASDSAGGGGGGGGLNGTGGPGGAGVKCKITYAALPSAPPFVQHHKRPMRR